MDLRIGHPHPAPDDGAVQSPGKDLPLPVDPGRHRTRQPIGLRIEGKDPVGEDLGKHGKHPVGEVYAGRPGESLPVESRAGKDIGRDIGDMDPERHRPVVLLLDGDRIIEILRGIPVDGDDFQRAEVPPLLVGDDGNLLCPAVGQSLHLLGEGRGKAEGGNDQVGVDGGISVGPENGKDPAGRYVRKLFRRMGGRIGEGGGVNRHLKDHHRPLLRSRRRCLNAEQVADLGLLGLHVPAFRRPMEESGEGLSSMGHNPYDHPFPASPGIFTGNVADHRIPVDRPGESVGRNEHILFSLGVDDKAVPVLVRLESTRQPGKAIGQGETAVGQADDLMRQDQSINGFLGIGTSGPVLFREKPSKKNL